MSLYGCRRHLCFTTLLLTAATLSSVLVPYTVAGDSARYLFVCAGDQARKNPDFLAVVNFDEDSSNYGKVIAQAPLPEPGATGNEFHHIGLSADGKVAACGGLLSALKGQKGGRDGACSWPRGGV
jgi:56kDa selenium binding protein (SBP56)